MRFELGEPMCHEGLAAFEEILPMILDAVAAKTRIGENCIIRVAFTP
jgi:hypothetical protein